MIFKYTFKAFFTLLVLIILNGFNITFAKSLAIPSVLPPKFSYPTPQVYPTNSPITPLGPITAGGAVPQTFFGLVVTFTGTGQFGTADGGPIVATFHFPVGVTNDGSGNLYVADYGNNLIRKVNSAGIVSTFAGNGSQGDVNGPANNARFFNPKSTVVDAAGNVYVADEGNHRIRMITQARVVSTFAGNFSAGSADGIGALAGFNNPSGLAIDGAGNIYVADAGNNMIRKITPAGKVSTIAGSGTKGAQNGAGLSASFNNPQYLTLDAAGNIYVSDSGNNLIRIITPAGLVSTFAGSGAKGSLNGSKLSASFNAPAGITIDQAENLFIADYGNNLIRMITPAGIVTTLAGSGGFGSFNNTGVVATFAGPSDVTIDASGNLFVADKYSNEIREVVTTGYFIDKPLPHGLTFDSSTGIISGTPTDPTPATTYTITGYNEGGSYSTTVTITIVAAAVNAPVITYPTPKVYTVNTAIVPLVVTNSGGTATGYTIDKTLPAGLTLDQVTGTISGIPATVSPATDYKITAENTGGSSSFTINITVTAKVLTPQTITFGAIPAKTYGNADFDPGAASTNNTIPVTYSSDNTSVATIINGRVHITGAGTSNITALQTGNDNYADAIPVVQLLIVSPAVLTITADNKTRVVGTLNPVLTVTYSGFVYNDTPGQLTAPPIITTTAVETSQVGDYTITVLGAISTNYTFIYVPGTLTITAVPPTISIPNAFTPNGDGFNDVWNIKSLIDYPKSILSVYSRYGGLIYQSKGYPKPWDGTLHGTQVPAGTYYYIIDLQNGTKPLSGYVTVLR